MLVRKSLQLRNTGKRERRLRGKVEDLMSMLKQQHLLSTQAEDLLSEKFFNLCGQGQSYIFTFKTQCMHFHGYQATSHCI